MFTTNLCRISSTVCPDTIQPRVFYFIAGSRVFENMNYLMGLWANREWLAPARLSGARLILMRAQQFWAVAGEIWQEQCYGRAMQNTARFFLKHVLHIWDTCGFLLRDEPKMSGLLGHVFRINTYDFSALKLQRDARRPVCASAKSWLRVGRHGKCCRHRKTTWRSRGMGWHGSKVARWQIPKL